MTYRKAIRVSAWEQTKALLLRYLILLGRKWEGWEGGGQHRKT